MIIYLFITTSIFSNWYIYSNTVDLFLVTPVLWSIIINMLFINWLNNLFIVTLALGGLFIVVLKDISIYTCSYMYIG